MNPGELAAHGPGLWKGTAEMAEFDFEKQLAVTETGIPGLKVVELSVHGDNRGWFKENWQRE